MTRALLTFDVPGEPIPKARPRLGRSSVFTPDSTKQWEDTVKRAAWAAMYQAGLEIQLGTLAMVLDFRRENDKKCDIDNLVKAVLDGCNETLYVDDKQVRVVLSRVVYKSGKLRCGVDVALFDEFAFMSRAAALFHLG